PPDPLEPSSPNPANEGASVALAEPNVAAAAGEGLAASNWTNSFSLAFAGAGGAVSSRAGAGAAADPGVDVKAELRFFGARGAAAILAASFLIASLLLAPWRASPVAAAPAEAGCCASTAGSAAIVILVCVSAGASGTETTADSSSTFADDVIAGIAAENASGFIAGSGASN